jgi:hypothetical protein
MTICNDQGRVTALLSFLLPAMEMCPPTGARYDHMGALLADVALQAGLNYTSVVLPRVQRVAQDYPHARRTTDVVDLLARVPANEILRWNGDDKLTRYRSLVQVCDLHRANTVEDLREFSSTSHGREAFLAIRGIGRKSFDYLRLLCGSVTFPMDRHFLRFLRIAGVDVHAYDYDASQEFLSIACRELKLQPEPVERGLWHLLRSC